MTDLNGVVLDTLRRDVLRETIPPEERADSIEAIQDRIDSIPVPLDEVIGMPEAVRELDVPELFPAFSAVYGSVDGEIWVRRWIPGRRDATVFDVFTDRGDFDRTVLLSRRIDAEPTPYISNGFVVGVTTDPQTDEFVVIRFAPEATR